MTSIDVRLKANSIVRDIRREVELEKFFRNQFHKVLALNALSGIQV